MKITILIVSMILSQLSYSCIPPPIGDPDSLTINGYPSFGDLNGDGYNDMFVSEFHYFNCVALQCYCRRSIDSSAKVLLNDKQGGFIEEVQVNEIGETNLDYVHYGMWDKITAYKTVIADLNNDGFNDVVFSDGRVLINDGQAQFNVAVYPGIGHSKGPLYAVDIDNDGVFEIFNDRQIRTRASVEPLVYDTKHFLTIDDTRSVKFIDFNNDNYLDIISFGANLKTTIYINNQSRDFSQFDKVELNFIENASLLVADVDGDGDVDIILSDNSVLKSDGQMNFQKIENSVNIVSDNLTTEKTIVSELINYNLDDYPDILLKSVNRFENDQIYITNDIYINDGHGKFNKADDTILSDENNSGERTVLIADFNNDGIDDMIINYAEVFSFVKSIYDENYIINHIDPIVSMVVDLKINKLLNYNLGLNFDPSHSGHGFSIEKLKNGLLYSVFYTYNDDGYPEWYADLSTLNEPNVDYWNIETVGSGEIKYQYDYATSNIFPISDNSNLGSLSYEKCSNNYGKINLGYVIGYDLDGMPLSSGDWCSQAIVPYNKRPIENFSGLWWAGDDDAGWGWSISLLEREDTTDMVLVLYYYDAQGNPRWLIGQQAGFVKGQEITLDMDMVKGYSRQSTPIDLSLIPAGTVSITLNKSSHNLSQAGHISVDVTYPGIEGGNWVRENIPIGLFSEAR